MKKFRITVTRTDEYEIEVDENFWDEKALKEWSKYFCDTRSPGEFAKHLGHTIMKVGSNAGFMEGFGYIKTFREDGSQKTIYDSELSKVSDKDYLKGITLKILSEDDGYEYDVEELTDNDNSNQSNKAL